MITIDKEKGEVSEEIDGITTTYPIGSPEAFQIISSAWLRSGWDAKYVYTFSWMGRPIIQLPEDMVRTQEVIYRIKPDVLIETGVAHGGSLIFYASLFKAMGKGRVIGIDIEIRPKNRKAIESHPMFDLITLVEGSSVAPEIVSGVHEMVSPSETALVILDSNHSRQHVYDELCAYSDLVSVGSYIVATDGIMKDLPGAPRTEDDWNVNNPYQAAKQFAEERDNFICEQPEWDFDESESLRENVTYWPGAWLKRLS